MARELKKVVGQAEVEELRTTLNLATKEIIRAGEEIKKVVDQLSQAKAALEQRLSATYAGANQKQEDKPAPKLKG